MANQCRSEIRWAGTFDSPLVGTVNLPASRSSVPDLAAAIGSALKRGRRACAATATMRCAKGEDKAVAVDSRCLRSTTQAFAEWERRFRSTPLGVLLQWAVGHPRRRKVLVNMGMEAGGALADAQQCGTKSSDGWKTSAMRTQQFIQRHEGLNTARVTITDDDDLGSVVLVGVVGVSDASSLGRLSLVKK